MKVIIQYWRISDFLLLILVLFSGAFFACSTSDDQQQENIPQNIAIASEFSTDLDNFAFSSETNFTDERNDLDGDFLADDLANDNFLTNESNSQGLFDEFANNVSLQETLANNTFPLEFNQTSEEVNSSLNNDTQGFAFNDQGDADFNANFAVNNNFFAEQAGESNQDFFASENSGNFFQVEEDSTGDFFNDTNLTPVPLVDEPSSFPAVVVDNSRVSQETLPKIGTPAFQQESVDSVDSYQTQVDILPSLHVLTWVGYELNETDRELRIEMMTRGNPEFQVFQEMNQAGQMELVFRFLQTSLRKKVRWDINASEFRSPVAYVRMRQDKQGAAVDVVLTLRDPIQPLFFAKDGNVLLTFKVPDRYYGAQGMEAVQAIDQAQRLSQYQLALDVQEGSDLPKVSHFQPDPSRGVFDSQNRQGIPIDQVIEPAPQSDFDNQGFPPSFDTSSQNISAEPEINDLFPSDRFQIIQGSVGAVGQDNLGQDNLGQDNLGDFSFGDDEPPPEGNANTSTNELANPLAEFTNADSSDNFFFNATEADTFSEGDFDAFERNGSQINEAKAAPAFAPSSVAAERFPKPNKPVSNESMFNESDLSDAMTVDPLDMENMDARFNKLPASQEIVGIDGGSRPQAQYDGRLVYMEFTEAPLSIVLKTFSVETNNNFVFPKDVGDLPITIHFQGVPWDEALKAILETHSLGMVKVGSNIVRVDGIDKLTAYMQKLEEAKQFEARRIPTKVLVMRLNNAKANDVLARLNPILERDRETDPRIRISADERTNSLVIEAPDYILSKTKNVIERLDLETPQVEIASRIVEVQKNKNDFFGAGWINRALANFDPGRGLGFGSLNFPNNMVSNFAVDPGVSTTPSVGNAQFRFGSINRFIDLDVILRMEERRGTTNILQSNRVLVLDGQEAMILAGNSKFFRPAAGGTVVNQGDGGGGGDAGLAEVKFNLSLEVKPQVTADGSVIMDLSIKSDTPGDPTGEVLADKNTRELQTQMIRESGDTGVIGGIYDTQRIESIVGVPFFSKLPIIGALFRSTNTVENQTELLIMVTPTIVSGRGLRSDTSSTSMGGSSFAADRSFFQDMRPQQSENPIATDESDDFDFNSNFGTDNASGIIDDNDFF